MATSSLPFQPGALVQRPILNSDQYLVVTPTTVLGSSGEEILNAERLGLVEAIPSLVGYHVYVDEGDGLGDNEFSAAVKAVQGTVVTFEDDYSVDLRDVAWWELEA